MALTLEQQRARALANAAARQRAADDGQPAAGDRPTAPMDFRRQAPTSNRDWRQAPTSNRDWFVQQYGREPEEFNAEQFVDEAGTARNREDQAGYNAWEDYLAALADDERRASTPNAFGDAMQGRPVPNVTTADMARPTLQMEGPAQVARSLGQGFFAAGDEAAGVVGGIGGVLSGAGWQAGYDRTVEHERERLDQYRAANPEAASILPFIGSLPLALIPGWHAAKGATMLTQAGRGAAGGFSFGAGFGLGGAEGEFTSRLPAAGVGAVVGAVTGGAIPLAAGAARAASRTLGITAPAARQAAAPTTQEMRTLAQQAYQRADQSGLVVEPHSFISIADDIANIALSEGLDPTLHPRITASIGRLIDDASRGQPISLQQIELTRRILATAGKSADADERRLAGLVVDEFDNWMDNLVPSDILAGNPAAASAALNEARTIWRTMRKTETVEQLHERALNAVGANYTVAGYETAIRQQFRALANNPARMRSFNEAEQEAILRVVRGGSFHNLIRRFGVFAPRGLLSGGFATAGAASGNIPMMGLTVLGEASKRTSQALSSRNVEAVDSLVRNGGIPPQLIPLPPSRSMAGAEALGLTATQQEYVLPSLQQGRLPVLYR